MLLFLAFVGLALAAASPLDEPDLKLQRGNCPMFWYSFNGRCYKYVASAMTWADAELNCVAQNSNLVSIRSVEEQDFVTDLIKNFDPSNGSTWVGLSDLHKEGHWMWSDGCPFRFSFWRVGEPNGHTVENCVYCNYESSPRWIDSSCSHRYPSVCASHILC